MVKRLEAARLKAILWQMGYRSGDGVSDKTGKSDLGQKFLVRGEHLALISQAAGRK